MLPQLQRHRTPTRYVLENEQQGQLILTFNATTKTQINEGMNQIFKENGWISITMLITSFLLSFLAGVRSHIDGISAHRLHFPFKCQVISMIYTTFALSSRALCMVMYFVPSLGLFSILKHWQAEQTPWDTDLVKNLVVDNYIQFGDSKQKVFWKSIDRWNNGMPPPYTLYTQCPSF